MPWDKIDTKLAANHFNDNDHEWLDEDAGWCRTSIHISVPFHNRTDSCGVEDFYLGNFYHPSLVNVLKSKTTNTEYHKWFHCE